jgi:hypothetical protein
VAAAGALPPASLRPGKRNGRRGEICGGLEGRLGGLSRNAGARCGARRGLQWGTAAALVSARTGAPDALNTWWFSLCGYDSSRGGDVLTAGSTKVRCASSVGSVAGPARVYPGATRGGVDSCGPRHACLPREGALPRWARRARAHATSR